MPSGEGELAKQEGQGKEQGCGLSWNWLQIGPTHGELWNTDPITWWYHLETKGWPLYIPVTQSLAMAAPKRQWGYDIPGKEDPLD